MKHMRHKPRHGGFGENRPQKDPHSRPRADYRPDKSKPRRDEPPRGEERRPQNENRARPWQDRRPDHRKPRPEGRPRREEQPRSEEGRAQDENRARPWQDRRPDHRKPRPESRPHRKEQPRGERPPQRREERPPQNESRAPREGILIWGLHAARAAWLNPKRRFFRMWATEAGLAAFAETFAEAKALDIVKRPDPKRVDRHELDRLTPPGSVHQGIVIEVAPLREPPLHDIVQADPAPDLVILLDQVTDPHNVGAILRSAAAFGAGAVIMTERNAPESTGVLAKAASGAIDHVPLLHVVNLARALDELREGGYWCVGLAEEGERDLGACDLSGRTAIVLGAEGEGLRQLTRKKCDELARMPTGGPIGSLNVSNAAAISLYEVRRQKGKFI